MLATLMLAVGVIGNGSPTICAAVAIVLFVLATLAGLADLRAPSQTPRYFWAPLVSSGLIFFVLALLLTPNHA